MLGSLGASCFVNRSQGHDIYSVFPSLSWFYHKIRWTYSQAGNFHVNVAKYIMRTTKDTRYF